MRHLPRRARVAIAQRTLHGYLERVPGPQHPGPRTPRTETAAVFAMGAVHILLQERGSWQPTD